MRLTGRMLSMCAWQFSTGARLADHESVRLPSASLIKVPIALAVLRARDRGLLPLEEAVPVDAVPVVGGAGVLRLLSGSPTWPVGDLLTLMITVSDNLATNLLLEQLDRVSGSAYAAVAEVCELAGLADTVLQRRMIDPAAVDAGRDNWTTAADQCRLMALIARGELSNIVDPESASLLRNVLLAQQLSSGLTEVVPADLQLGHKTGSLAGILHDAGFLLSPTGTPIAAIAVLTRGAPGEAARMRTALTDRAGQALLTVGEP